MALSWCFSFPPPIKQCESCLGLPGIAGVAGPPGPQGPPGPSIGSSICAGSFNTVTDQVPPNGTIALRFTPGSPPLSSCSCVIVDPTDPTQLLITSPGGARIYVSGQLWSINVSDSVANAEVLVNGVPLTSDTVFPSSDNTLVFGVALASQSVVGIAVRSTSFLNINSSVVTVQILDGSCVSG